MIVDVQLIKAYINVKHNLYTFSSAKGYKTSIQGTNKAHSDNIVFERIWCVCTFDDL